MQASAHAPSLAPMRAVSTRVSRCIWPTAGAALPAVWMIGLVASIVVTQRANHAYVGQQSPLRWFEEFSRAGSVIYGGDFVVLPSALHDMSAVKMSGTWVRSFLLRAFPVSTADSKSMKSADRGAPSTWTVRDSWSGPSRFTDCCCYAFGLSLQAVMCTAKLSFNLM